MDGRVDENEAGPAGAQPRPGALATVGGPVVDDPEHAAGRPVGLLGHDLRDEAIEGRDAGRRLAAAEDLGPMHIPRSQIGPRPAPLVFVFDVHRAPRRGGERRMNAEPSLDARFLIGRQDVLARAERDPVPAPRVQFQDALGLGGECRVAGENPTPMPPGAQGVLAEPAPQGGPTDLGDEPLRHDRLLQVAERPVRQRHSALRGQLTREGLDGDDDSGGKSGPAARPEATPRGPAADAARSVFSTC